MFCLPVGPHFCRLCFPTTSCPKDVNAYWFICWQKIIINTDGQIYYQVNGDKFYELNCVIKLSFLWDLVIHLCWRHPQKVLSGWSSQRMRLPSLQWRRITSDVCHTWVEYRGNNKFFLLSSLCANISLGLGFQLSSPKCALWKLLIPGTPPRFSAWGCGGDCAQMESPEMTADNLKAKTAENFRTTTAGPSIKCGTFSSQTLECLPHR